MRSRPKLKPVGKAVLTGTVAIATGTAAVAAVQLLSGEGDWDLVFALLGILVPLAAGSYEFWIRPSRPELDQPVYDRIRASRDEFAQVSEQLHDLVQRSQHLVRELDDELAERDRQIAERDSELKRLEAAQRLEPEQLVLLRHLLDNSQQEAAQRSRGRDFRFLVYGAVTGALLGIPGNWIASWVQPLLFG